MPAQFGSLDTNFPSFTGQETTEQKVNALYDYTFMLLETLRYILRNLDWSNFNQEALDNYPGKIEADVIVSNTVITNELYSEYGAIADLVVDELRTDYLRAARYLAGVTTPIDYLHIYDEEIDFITATVKSGAPTEQLHHGSRYFWWTDETMTQMTSIEPTAYPVTVYQYDELVKGTIRFDTVDGTKIPQFILGAGYGQQDHPDRGKGFIRKNSSSFDLWMETATGLINGLFIGDSYTDLAGLRKPTQLDFSGWDNGTFVETLDGSITNSFAIDFDANDRPVKFTDASGHETAVVWDAV